MSTRWISVPATEFTMGASNGPHPEDGESPPRPVALDTYQLSQSAVTNAEFSVFVAATGYVSTAERAGGSLVFAGQLQNPQTWPIPDPRVPWWHWVDGACWSQPWSAGEVVDASLAELPVTHVSWFDALAYAQWLDARLPTEAEWEYAASVSAPPPVIWQGEFPNHAERPPYPVEVHHGEGNEFGFQHLCGNVWEWVADRFTRLHSPRLQKNPAGPLNGNKRVLKGGSYLCAPSYCARYHPSSRRGDAPETTTSHQGFRVARDARNLKSG